MKQARPNPMYAPIRRECGTCAFFRRYTPEVIENKVIGVKCNTDLTPVEEHEQYQNLLEFGKCVRYPPQFFYETLNGEWPVVHQSHYCGEHRVDDHNPHRN